MERAQSALLALPAIEYAERSDPGRDPEKQVNEDACGHRETRFGHLCVVCDGMGGHAAGREAAELAATTIFEVFEGASEGTPPAELLRSAIEEANRRVHVMRTSEVAMGRPGSTVVAVLLHGGGTEVAHVGDSRAYLVEHGQIFRLTRDHSIVQELVDRGLLSPERAAHHPEANRITRALGMAVEISAELLPQPVHHVAGDAFVLCSDGLSDLVADGEILGIVGAEPPAQAVAKLVDMANARGGHDNVTVVVLRARETAAAATAAGGVAPTLAQTSASQPAPSAIGSSPTRLEAPHSAALNPAATSPLARPLEPTPPPLSTRSVPTGRRGGPAVILGLAVTGLVATLLAWALVEYFEEPAGKRRVATGPTVLDLSPSDARASDAPTPLAPEGVVAPAMSAPSEPIAPLDPTPSSPKSHKR
jgi:PPM family protein phosphatase